MQKAVISPLNNVTFKGGDQHSEGGDQQKKNLSPRAPVGAKKDLLVKLDLRYYNVKLR